MRPIHALGSLALVLLARTAAAAPTEGEKRAEELFLEGRAAATAGDYATACGRFAQSLALVERAGTLLNLADCEDRAGRPLAASRFLHRAVPLLDPKDERLTFTKNRLADLERRVAHLRLGRPAGMAAGTRISLDGRWLEGGEIDGRIAVEPGDHVIGVEEPGRPPRKLDVRVGEGAEESVSLAPGAEASPSPSPPPQEGPAGNEHLVPALVAGGVGLAGLGLAAVTGAVLLGRDADIVTECPDQQCSPAGRELIDGQGPLFAVNAVGFGLGALGVGAAVVLLLTGSGEDEAARSSPLRWAAGPVHGGGVAIVGGDL